MRDAWASGFSAAFAFAALGCGPPSSFLCEHDNQCGSGTCQPEGYCSFPDPECPTGERYGDLAPGGLSGSCVEPPPGTSGDSTSTGTSAASVSASATTTDTTQGPTTDVGTSSGSTAAVSISESTGSTGSTGSDQDTTTSDGSSTGAAGQSTGAVVSCPDFVDDFEDGVIGAGWELSHPEFTAELGGSLQLIVDPPAGPFVEAILSEHYDLSQGWFRVRLDELPDSFYTQSDVEVFNGDDLDESVLLLVEGDVIVARYRPLGGGFDNLLETTFLPDEHVWLQLRGDGTTVYFETSADGVSFEALTSYEVPFPLTNVHVGMRASNYGDIPENDIVSYAEIAVCTDG